jgi:L,D-peptidoglycan transpeptidase YkuD (ErfK/YbiS/YcfS/YnhG family)
VRPVRLGAIVVLFALVAIGCGSTEPEAAPAPSTTTSTTSTAPVATSRATVAPTRTPTSAPPLPDPRLGEVGTAGQAIVVTGASPGTTTATLTAYERAGPGWRTVFGPWTARVGARGIAPAGAKREGDGRTPSGVYGFDFFFGVAADPGVHFPYRRVTDRSIVWDDDPASPTYNLWRDTDTDGVGVDPEPMYTMPAYEYGAVIAYNTDRTPGLGSAIFLHESTGGPTAGCVSLPAEQLLQVLRWLDPGRQPRIVLGVAS